MTTRHGASFGRSLTVHAVNHQPHMGHHTVSTCGRIGMVTMVAAPQAWTKLETGTWHDDRPEKVCRACVRITTHVPVSA